MWALIVKKQGGFQAASMQLSNVRVGTLPYTVKMYAQHGMQLPPV